VERDVKDETEEVKGSIKRKEKNLKDTYRKKGGG
jgi:hypothetical protein